MAWVLVGGLLVFACGLALPAFYLAVLTLAAVWQRLRYPVAPPTGHAPAAGELAFVVPAHNEETVVVTTIRSLRAAADPQTTIHVIADNCTDATAQRAREAGAIVWERADPTQKSKGHALAWALPQVMAWTKNERAAELSFIAVVDADATLSANSVALARQQFAAGALILQSEYQLIAGVSLRAQIVRIAFAAFNIVRGLGRLALGLSDVLKGNGMWFQALVLREHPWRAYSLAEDLEFSLYLRGQGYEVVLLAGSTVTGMPGESPSGAKEQRARWEGGRLALVLDALPKACWRLVSAPSWDALDLVFELLTPPLAFYVVLLGVFTGSMALLPWDVTQSAAGIGLVALAATLMHAVAAIWTARLPPVYYWYLVQAPVYLVWKLRLLPLIWQKRRAKEWVRTDRS